MNVRKLTIQRESLGELSATELSHVAGGHSATPDCVTCQVTLRGNTCSTCPGGSGLTGLIKINTAG